MTRSLEDDELIDLLRSSAESIYAHLESLGPDLAKKARELRATNARLIRAASESASSSGYYRRFKKPLEPTLIYLFNVGSPIKKQDVASALVAEGFIGESKSGPYKAIIDCFDYQTKPANNGRLNIEDLGNDMMQLTDSGRVYAEDLIKKCEKLEL